MPIYEYRCKNCKRRVSLFFPSFSAAESRTAAGENACPRCGSSDLSRLMSRAFTLRSDAESDDSFDEDMPSGDSDIGGGGGGGGDMEDMFAGLDEEDPRSIARWARQMKDSMGPDADLGPGFDRALARIEAGEDPDKVMEDTDPEELGGDMGGEDFDDSSDF